MASFAARTSLRTVARSSPRSNLSSRLRYSSVAPAEGSNPALQKYLDADHALQHHAAQTTDLWRKISYFVCVPAIAVCVAWVYNAEAEHAAHIEHIKHENGGELPPTPAFDYLNRRVKPYPWGMNSLFFNPHVNKNLEE